jgi:hypothetical protein
VLDTYSIYEKAAEHGRGHVQPDSYDNEGMHLQFKILENYSPIQRIVPHNVHFDLDGCAHSVDGEVQIGMAEGISKITRLVIEKP